jgi:hypothetical protein
MDVAPAGTEACRYKKITVRGAGVPACVCLRTNSPENLFASYREELYSTNRFNIAWMFRMTRGSKRHPLDVRNNRTGSVKTLCRSPICCRHIA